MGNILVTHVVISAFRPALPYRAPPPGDVASTFVCEGALLSLAGAPSLPSILAARRHTIGRQYRTLALMNQFCTCLLEQPTSSARSSFSWSEGKGLSKWS